MKKFKTATMKPKLFFFKGSFSKQLNNLHRPEASKDRPDRAVALKRGLCCVINLPDGKKHKCHNCTLKNNLLFTGFGTFKKINNTWTWLADNKITLEIV